VLRELPDKGGVLGSDYTSLDNGWHFHAQPIYH
jgi:hypothetical protein